uniref:Secreted protein n=1 Tax=Triticum urartu TaxID=4572 RepID=A0A8R7TDT0_TRIUA
MLVPAFHVIAALRFLHEHLALGAPLPPLPAHEAPEQEVVPATLVLPELLELLAPHAVVPWHAAPGAQEPVAVRALRLRDGLLRVGVGEKERRAFLVRAVHPLEGADRELAQQETPPVEEVRGDDAAAALRLDGAGLAAWVRACHASDLVVQLRGHVLGEAAPAEGVAARADAELEGAGHRLHADGAAE